MARIQISARRKGSSDADSCIALESAAGHGSVEAVQMLLDDGARIQNRTPMHFAAGVCPPGANPHVGCVNPSKYFDVPTISVKRLLVENGVYVNYKVESRHMNPQYAIVHAMMAGAIERAKWLIEQGADPILRRFWKCRVLRFCLGRRNGESYRGGSCGKEWSGCRATAHSKVLC